MADCEVGKLDSNVSGLFFAEEECLKQLPANPVWYAAEPNDFSDFGAETTTTARSPISPSRSKRKGTVTDLDADGGFNTDVTLTNMVRLMQGFCFADARQRPSTAPLNAARITVTAVDAATKSVTGSSALGVFTGGSLVAFSGFGVPTNNGLKVVDKIDGGTLVTVDSLVSEANPPSYAKVTEVGRQFAQGDVSLTYAAGILTLTAVAGDFTSLGLIPGQWIFIGGDASVNRYANNVGFARASAISAKTMILDNVSWSPKTEAGAAVALRIFVGTVVRNETLPELIKRRSYQLERSLGQDSDGTQAEYLIGAVPNELTLNIPQADMLNADLTFVACDSEFRTGKQGLKSGLRIPIAEEDDAYNTTSDVYRIKMSIIDKANPNSTALFGYVSEASVEVTNNLEGNKALGVLGSFDVTAGDFEVGGSVTAFFTSVESASAVRRNADVGIYGIFSKDNKGMLYDIPLLSLGGGRINVEKDAPITIPLDTNGAQSKYGHTLLFEFFDYLPSVAMPQ